MAYDITAEGNLLQLDVVVTMGDFQSRGHSFLNPSVDLAVDKIKFFEGGIYKIALNFTDINEVGGVAPSDIEDAYEKIKELIENFNGGGIVPTPIEDILKYGAEEFIIDGIETIFLIPHGMDTVPTSFAVTFGDAANLNFVQSTRTIDATNITFTCNTPPLVGTQTVYWQVFK